MLRFGFIRTYIKEFLLNSFGDKSSLPTGGIQTIMPPSHAVCREGLGKHNVCVLVAAGTSPNKIFSFQAILLPVKKDPSRPQNIVKCPFRNIIAGNDLQMWTS